ncbi:hypothetical protein N656DRAFT_802552 [Canariomyces notabilis]|uniref:Heterokaryon incompatibility domain-containing protein n=1 Tax=Canariomyces notabilis TaxID=2074819 RepID=A0AAN6QCI2_9PEZI|nr:hypothetical protein N656DRAFT_802552 [Canariomyces arenarius]
MALPNNDKPPQIICSGKRVVVGQNLYDASRNLRRPDSERILWVDALCINQNDPLEKAQQLPRMGSIYEKAESVIIWLGEPTKSSSEAISTLRKLNEHFTASLFFYNESSWSVWARQMIYRKFPSMAAGDWHRHKTTLAGFNWTAVADVMKNPWFLRVWVYQELRKATSAVVALGNEQMPLNDFIRPIAELFMHPLGMEIIGPHLSADAYRSLVTILRIVTEDGPEARNLVESRRPLLDFVARESFRDVTNDRDRIFAFCDVANDVDETDWEVIPDYTATVEHVSGTSTSRGYTSGRDGRGGTAVLVPDWRQNRLEILNPFPGHYNASGTSELHVSWRPDQPTLLRIMGRIVDTVDEVSISRMHLTGLDHFEFASGTKFDPAAVSKLVKRRQRFSFLKWFKRDKRDQALDDIMSKYLVTRDRQGSTKTFEISSLREAHEARQRFGTEKLPAHEMTNLVWMEDCKYIAAKCTGGHMTPDRLDALWRTMTYSSPSLPKRNFVSYLALLDDIGQGRRKTESLQGTSFELPRNRARAAEPRDIRHLAKTQWRRQLPRLPGMDRRSSSPLPDDNELHLRRTMHSIFGSVFSRRFCATSQNRLGWVPVSARAGDVICVLDGVKLPVVLRPLSKKGNEHVEEEAGTGSTAIPVSSKRFSGGSSSRYQLIGPCYIDGIMHGELMKGRPSEGNYLELS